MRGLGGSESMLGGRRLMGIVNMSKLWSILLQNFPFVKQTHLGTDNLRLP